MTSRQAEKISKALADPHRIKIIQEIKNQQDELFCCDLDNILNLSQPSICHHLKLLADTEIIIQEKEGKYVKYRLNNMVLDEYISFLESLATA
jgi:ArsR family transcriptional regulator, arsenate/arsenite/antimonite-responsive transcriptional repressor